MLSFTAEVFLRKPRILFGSALICPSNFTGPHLASLPLAMVTRSAKRRLLQQRTSTAKRRNITEPEDSPTLKRAEKSDKTTAKSSTTDATEGGPSFFLFKSEPESRIQNGHEMKYSIDDLAAEPDQTTYWDGVRNAEARNTMKAMKKGDLGFFYHSNTRKSRPGIIGIVEVVKEAYPDHTAFDKNDPHYDPKSSKDTPKWFMVDVRLVEKFHRCITLDQVKANEQLSQMMLVKRGRVSVQRVQPDEWEEVLKMAKNTKGEKS